MADYALAQTGTAYKELPEEELWQRYDRAKGRKKWDDALTYIQELVLQYPEKAKYLFEQADTLLQMGRITEAIAGFDKVIEKDSDYLEAYIGRAKVYAKGKPPKDRLAMEEMVTAAKKGYPVREMQRMPELHKYLREDVRFFLKIVESDVPRVTQNRDPFVCPLKKMVAEGEETDEGEEERVGPVDTDPEPVQREKMYRMKELLEQVHADLAAGKEEDARVKYNEFKALYRDVELGKITKDEYRENMIKFWKLAQEKVHARLREIELRKFRQEADEALKKLQMDYDEKDLEAARQHNEEFVKILDPKLNSKEEVFVEEAKKYDDLRSAIFEKIKILEEFEKNIRPFIKVTGTITSPTVKIAMMETVFGGELKKLSLQPSDKLPRMEDLTVSRIEEELVWAKYRGEEVKMPLGAQQPSVAPAAEEP
jgi:tetratricopeptide (TPR) repeat protein